MSKAKQQACAECRQPGAVGADVVPYSVQGRNGKGLTRWLHPACEPAWRAKYLAWLKGGDERDPGVAAGVAMASIRKTLETL